MDPIQFVHEQLETTKKFPAFKPGDTIVVSYRIVEGDKERIQAFKGDVIQTSGEGATKTFTVRKVSNGVGVERIFPVNTPSIVSIEVLKKGRVRRAKLFYLRKLSGKKSRIKERKFVKKQ